MSSICENEKCKKGHDGSFGRGRFCCRKCANSYSTSMKRNSINEKISKKWDNKLYKGRRIEVIEDQIRNTINECNSMRELSIKLDLSFGVMRKITLRLGLYLPNKGGKGGRKLKIEELLTLGEKGNRRNGVYIKKRLLEEGLKQYRCEECENSGRWMNKELVLELDHINGKYWDNRLVNLRIICPNCHSQTPTFRNKIRMGTQMVKRTVC